MGTGIFSCLEGWRFDAHVDRAVQRETRWIAWWVIGLSAVLQLVFVLLGRWQWPVLWGNLFGGFIAVLNFFLMGLTVQRAVGREEKQIKNLVRSSQYLRLLMQGAAMLLAFRVGWLDPWATVIPLFFPRLAIILRPLWDPSLRRKKPAPDPDNTAGGETD